MINLRFTPLFSDEDFESAVRNLKGKLYVDGADGASDHGRLLYTSGFQTGIREQNTEIYPVS